MKEEEEEGGGGGGGGVGDDVCHGKTKRCVISPIENAKAQGYEERESLVRSEILNPFIYFFSHLLPASLLSFDIKSVLSSHASCSFSCSLSVFFSSLFSPWPHIEEGSDV